MTVIHLQHGAHATREEGMCAVEAVAYIAGETHSDHPLCVSPVLATFLRSWNDGLPTDAHRDRLLKPLLPVVLHTHTTEADEETRAWMATDWMVRICAPAWLDAAGLDTHAAALRTLPALTSSEIAVAVQDVLAAAWDAAWAAAWDAAWAAAWDAAWDAARAAAWDAARDAAGDAARDAAGDAAWTAAAAGAAVAPTVAPLQSSAQDLVRRMAAVGVRHEGRMVPDRLAEVCRT